MQTAQRLFDRSQWLALAATLLLVGCGADGSDGDQTNTQTPDSTAATTSAKSPPASPLPTPGTSNATLSWRAPTENTNGSALTDLTGYKLYYGTAPGQLTSTIALSNPGLLTYVIDGLTVGVTYYFAVAAVASDGMESALSDVASKTIS
jgi:hypothetical protein